MQYDLLCISTHTAFRPRCKMEAHCIQACPCEFLLFTCIHVCACHKTSVQIHLTHQAINLPYGANNIIRFLF